MKLRRLMQIAGPGTKATKRQRCASQQNWPANDAMGQKRTAARFGHVRYTPKGGQTQRRSRLSAECHVWTAPSWQELSSRKQHWSVQP